VNFALGVLTSVALIAITAVATAWAAHTSEHRRWLRAERLRAYSVLIAAATRLDQAIDESHDDAKKIDAMHAVEAAEAEVEVLGPDSAREAAQGIVFSHVGDGDLRARAEARSEFLRVAAKMLRAT
jgi:hypothetical protein